MANVIDLVAAGRRVAAALMLLAALGASVEAVAQEKSWAQLLLSTERERCVVGEPLAVRAHFENRRGTAFEIDDAFHFGRKLEIHYAANDEAFRAWKPPLIEDIFSYRRKVVPVEGLTEQRRFATVFTVPGQVRLKAIFSSGDVSWESNIVTVEVEAPAAGEAEASRLWLDPDVLFVVENPTFAGMLPEGVEKLRRLREAFPRSRYLEFTEQKKIVMETKALVLPTTADASMPAQPREQRAAVAPPGELRAPETRSSWLLWLLGAGVAAIGLALGIALCRRR